MHTQLLNINCDAYHLVDWSLLSVGWNLDKRGHTRVEHKDIEKRNTTCTFTPGWIIYFFTETVFFWNSYGNTKAADALAPRLAKSLGTMLLDTKKHKKCGVYVILSIALLWILPSKFFIAYGCHKLSRNVPEVTVASDNNGFQNGHT